MDIHHTLPCIATPLPQPVVTMQANMIVFRGIIDETKSLGIITWNYKFILLYVCSLLRKLIAGSIRLSQLYQEISELEYYLNLIRQQSVQNVYSKNCCFLCTLFMFVRLRQFFVWTKSSLIVLSFKSIRRVKIHIRLTLLCGVNNLFNNSFLLRTIRTVVSMMLHPDKRNELVILPYRKLVSAESNILPTGWFHCWCIQTRERRSWGNFCDPVADGS